MKEKTIEELLIETELGIEQYEKDVKKIEEDICYFQKDVQTSLKKTLNNNSKNQRKNK